MKVAPNLYHLRKQGSEKENVLITFATQEEADAFKHTSFDLSVSIPLGEDTWAVGGSFRLESLEDLEAVETIQKVWQDAEFTILPVGGPIEF